MDLVAILLDEDLLILLMAARNSHVPPFKITVREKNRLFNDDTSDFLPPSVDMFVVIYRSAYP